MSATYPSTTKMSTAISGFSGSDTSRNVPAAPPTNANALRRARSRVCDQCDRCAQTKARLSAKFGSAPTTTASSIVAIYEIAGMVTNGMPMPLVLFSTAPIITDTMTTTICDVVMLSSQVCEPQVALFAV